MKATHYGHCQACGRFQKAPGGLIAKHGYTTQHGFFEGVCIGSGELPLEVSCDLIARSIEAAEKRAEFFRTEAEKIEGELSFRMERRTTLKGFQYVKVAVLSMEGRILKVSDGTKTMTMTMSCESAEQAVRRANHAYAAYLMTKREGCFEYIEAQKEVVKNWKPSEMKEV